MPFCHVGLRAPKKPSLEPVSEDSPLGEHLRHRRVELGIEKKEAAQRLGVCRDTYRGWEEDRVAPLPHQWPVILSYLGRDPFPRPVSHADRLLLLPPTATKPSPPNYQPLSDTTPSVGPAAVNPPIGPTVSEDVSSVGRWEAGRCVPARRPCEVLSKLLEETSVT